MAQIINFEARIYKSETNSKSEGSKFQTYSCPDFYCFGFGVSELQFVPDFYPPWLLRRRVETCPPLADSDFN